MKGLLFMKKTLYSDEINRLSNREKHFFAAANTSAGFVSFFDRVFDPNALSKLYILKGGPGVGKSTLMKKAASAAKAQGCTPLYYHCSSDPNSLDGVIIPETGKAIIDGTAPHTVDPRYAGAKEEIVNLGEAWNIPLLEKESRRICEISDQKSAHYRTAYRLLAAAKNADAELADMGARCLDRQKMRAAAARLCAKHIKKGGSAHLTLTAADAISCDGELRFFTPEKQAKHLYFIKDAHSTAGAFFAVLAELALRAGADITAGVRPLDVSEYAFLYFHEPSVCVSLYDDEFCAKLDRAEIPYKVINLGRFFDAKRFAANRAKYRFTEKCRRALIDAAEEELAAAGALHAELERIYGKATDYSVVSEMSEKVVAAVLRK